MRWPSPSVAPMNISATMMTTSATETAVRRPTKVCGSVSKKMTSRKMRSVDAPIERAARMRVCLRVHHAVGDVEHDHQPGGERGDRDLRELAEAEQQQEQREHRGRRRRAEEVDDEFERAVDAFVGAEHDADRHAERRRDREGIGDPQRRRDEVLGHLAGDDVVPGVRERRERRRQQVRIDQRAGIRDPPDRDQQDRPGNELDHAAHALAAEGGAEVERRLTSGFGYGHELLPGALRPKRSRHGGQSLVGNLFLQPSCQRRSRCRSRRKALIVL